MIPLRAALVLLACPLGSVAGCAVMAPGEGPGPAAPGPPSADQQELARAYDQLRRADADLHAAQAQTQAAAPDCARIGQLRDNICALAARICQIADRQPAGSTAAERCADGKARCKAAVDAVETRGCPTKKGLPGPSPSG